MHAVRQRIDGCRSLERRRDLRTLRGRSPHVCAVRLFDTSAPFECLKPVPARVSPKDVRNTCSLYEPRTTVERETKSSGPPSARKAFDDLFK
jgi:hypothetical protein